MKTKIKIYSLSLILLLAGSAGVQAQMTIGSQDKPHDGAVLHLNSTNKGLLLPNVALNADLTQFVLNGAAKRAEAKGMLVYNTTDNKVYVWDGTKWHPLLGTGDSAGEETPVGTVSVETAGGTLIFMDRNLGAGAGNPNPMIYNAGDDENPTGYLNGDYYQWGRKADGHERWNSSIAYGPIETTDADGQVPISNATHYGKFITPTTTTGDWRLNPDPNLWNGNGGKGNPCPAGFHVPTKTEWEAVRVLILKSNYVEIQYRRGLNIGFTDVFLPAAGARRDIGRMATGTGWYCNYWSSTSMDDKAHVFHADPPNGIEIINTEKCYGLSVRCVKN